MPTHSRPRSFLQELLYLRSQHLFRNLREIEAPQSVHVRHAGQDLLNFSSNDYLGLANATELKDAAKAAIDEYGVGSGASRLVCGSLSPHLRVEEAIAKFKGTEAALLFSTGYAASVGTISAVCGRKDIVILDKLCHASLIDGARLSGATVRVFPHNHMGKLESHLAWAQAQSPESRVLVVTESVFSMDGDRAPLREIVDLKDQYEALLLLDEAHGVGVLGKEGRGLADLLGVSNRVDFQMGTLSKALGGAGGYIAAERHAIDLLINRARSFIYSTAPAPALSAAALAAIELLQTPAGAARQEQLHANLREFHMRVSPFFPQLEPPQSAIIPLILGPEDLTLAASRWLRMQGFLIPAIRYPTVAKGTARLRITMSASHTSEDVARLAEALHQLSRKLKSVQAEVQEAE